MIVYRCHDSRGMPVHIYQLSGLCVRHDAQAKASAQRAEAFADIEATFSTLSRD